MENVLAGKNGGQLAAIKRHQELGAPGSVGARRTATWKTNGLYHDPRFYRTQSCRNRLTFLHRFPTKKPPSDSQQH
jgi:hypothetical protein